jgi:hypothetical protein
MPQPCRDANEHKYCSKFRNRTGICDLSEFGVPREGTFRRVARSRTVIMMPEQQWQGSNNDKARIMTRLACQCTRHNLYVHPVSFRNVPTNR